MLPVFVIKDHFAEYESILYEFGGVEKTIDKGLILSDANNTDKLTSYYIKKGIAKFSFIKEDGTENIIFFMSEGAIYPIHFEQYTFSIEKFLHFSAITDLTVIAFPSKRVLDIGSRYPSFFTTALADYGIYVNTLLTKILLNTYTDSTVCICSFIYLYFNNSKPSFFLTQDEIAQIVGMSRSQVTRILAKLKNEGIIETSRNRIKILDLQKLKSKCSSIITNDY